MKKGDIKRLRTIIDDVFDNNLSRITMLNEMKKHIDLNYTSMDDSLGALNRDIDRSGGYYKWRVDLMRWIKEEVLDDINK